jgi:hypothetical protein
MAELKLTLTTQQRWFFGPAFKAIVYGVVGLWAMGARRTAVRFRNAGAGFLVNHCMRFEAV